jgi:4-hydroxy-tetrahydrodipicolinate synthase
MFHGSIVALVTPFDAQGHIDFPALSALIAFHLQHQTSALVVCGSTGEAATLSESEQQELIRFVIKEVAGRIPVIVGTGTNCTQKTIERTQKAMELGADACLIVTPYYNKPTQQGLFLHYKTIATAVALPMILYNIPGRSAVDLLPETVIELAKIPNIIGIKESSNLILERTTLYKNLCHDQLDIFSGDDLPGLDAVQQGAKGVISVTANVVPALMSKAYEFALAGNFKQAYEIHEQLRPLHENLFVETNPIPVKWALYRMGLIQNQLRLPLTPLTESKQIIVEQALSKVKLI